MTVTVAGLPFEFIQMSAASGTTGFFFKSTKDAYLYNVGTQALTKVTSPNYPATTVPGSAYLDGTFYVMTPAAQIYGSNLEDPTTWSALNVIVAQMEPDSAVYITRLLNLIVAFGAYTTEFFYDAGNPTGSPLLPYSSAFVEVGCAAAGSVAQIDNTLYFMGVTKQKGRSIYQMQGTTPQVVSDPFIDRILNADDLATVRSYCIRVSGHRFYVLTLVTSAVTLVYDTTTGVWAEWTSSTAQSTKSVTSLTQSGGVATAVVTAHGYSDGDPVTIAGATPSGYNGTFNITYVDANTFTFPASSGLSSPASGTITSQGWTSSYFGATFYAAVGNVDALQFGSTGAVYAMDPSTYQDFGNPVDVRIRTAKTDFGSTERKFCSEIKFVGDKVTSKVYLRYTNDDYQTYSNFIPIDMGTQRSLLNRLGVFRRRAWEVRHTDNTAFRAEALEGTFTKGTN